MSILHIDPLVTWGLISRFIGALYIIAFGSLIPDLMTLVGSEGLGPIAPRLARARHDFPRMRRFLEFLPALEVIAGTLPWRPRTPLRRG